MEYRRLGRCGLKVSEICLGTMTFGHGTNATEAERMVGTALDAGVMFFDTADGYSDGLDDSEREAVWLAAGIATFIGQAIADEPERFIVEAAERAAA